MYQPALNSAVSVSNYGAMGNGVADDSAAVRRAVDAVAARGGGQISFPKGTYLFESPVLVSNVTGVSFVGEQGARIVTTFERDFRKFAVTGSRGISFANLVFEGGKTGAASAGNNFSGVVSFEDSKDGLVQNCGFFNYRGAGVLVYGASDDVLIQNNSFSGHFCGIYSFSKEAPVRVPSRISVLGNQFGPTWSAGAETACIKLQNQHGQNPPSYGHIVANNNIASTCQMGVELWNGIRGATVIGNVFSGTTWGISLDNVYDTTVNGNSCLMNPFAGIEAASACGNVTINANTVDMYATGTGAAGTYGLLAANGNTDIVFSNNYVRGYTYGGQVFGVNDTITFDNNVVMSCQTAFNPQGAFSNLSITNNKVETGVPASYLVLVDVSSVAASGLVMRGNYFNGATTDQSIFIYNNGNGSLTNLLVENNVVGPKSRGGSNGGNSFFTSQFTPYNAVARNNFAVSGATAANSIADFSTSSSTAYGDSNVVDGWQMYKNTVFRPTGAINSTSGAWFKIYSRSDGKVIEPKFVVASVGDGPPYTFDNIQDKVEFSVTMTPYALPNGHSITVFPQGNYGGIFIDQIRTHNPGGNDVQEVWCHLRSGSAAVSGYGIIAYGSDSSLLDGFSLQYEQPEFSSNSTQVMLNGTYQETFKNSIGYGFGKGSYLVEPSSGVLSTASRLGIGTLSPSAQLHTTSTVRFANFGAGTATFDANGNVSSVSDERFKHILRDYDRGLESVTGLRPIYYKHNKASNLDLESVYVGFGAQTTAQHIPEAAPYNVHYRADESGNPTRVVEREWYSFNDRALIASLVNSVKQLHQRLEDLETKTKKSK